MKQDALTGAAGRQPLVSVIMPAYNAEKYIGEAIASVCVQTYENWELLILDDGSADRTAEIAQAYAQRDARIRVLRNPQNMGVARTRNRGFDLARGEWIALLDSDDRWRAQKLEKQLTLAVHSGSRLLYTSYALFADAEREMRVYRVPQSVDYRRLLGENVIGCSTVLLHRSLLERLRFREDVFHEDYALWLAILRGVDSAAGCTEVLADWRISEQSRSFDKRAAAKTAGGSTGMSSGSRCRDQPERFLPMRSMACVSTGGSDHGRSEGYDCASGAPAGDAQGL